MALPIYYVCELLFVNDIENNYLKIPLSIYDILQTLVVTSRQTYLQPTRGVHRGNTSVYALLNYRILIDVNYL
ncbi:CCAAT-binding factor subunit B [Glaciecola sp. KUL10]|nr:CCAAT-binding factor subunit B [Glaciecola sp. KUL10]